MFLALLLAGSAACSTGGSDQAHAAAGAFRPLAVGDSVPAYQTITLGGDTIRLGGAAPVTLVNVWATWCESCREEMQDLDAIYREFKPRGLRVVAVSVDNGDGTRVRRYVESQRLTFPIAHDRDGVVQERFNTVGVPESYLIGPDGRLLWKQTGGIHGNVGAARAAIARVIPPARRSGTR